MLITHTIHPSQQKYWSIVVYDEYGICLPQYIYDDNYITNTQLCRTASNNKLYPICVRLSPYTYPPGDSVTTEVQLDIKGLRVNKSQFKGYVLFRLVHPTIWNDKIASTPPRVVKVKVGEEEEEVVEGNNSHNNNKMKKKKV